ncbi:metallophosphoesterase [Sphingomonas aurantiaca]|uniref:metallophosphoesterase n=1 Tax=Sphingomonas aurantiaca TaxID=185949 RepID=UPI002FDF5A85
MSANIASARSFAGPKAKRLYAIGDVHGRLDLVNDLLGRIEDDISSRPVETAVVVFLGDLIDRGPESAGVIERLQSLQHFPARMLFLLGNHEEFLLRALAGSPASRKTGSGSAVTPARKAMASRFPRCRR